MSERKLARVEACAELARRIWPDAKIHRRADGRGVSVRNQAWNGRSFAPFIDHAAARELVAWIRRQGRTAQRFVASLATVCDIPQVHDGASYYDSHILLFLVATPEQITLAACAALGIELDD